MVVNTVLNIQKHSKTFKTFKNMEGALHNLVPAIGEVNADRSNLKYGLIDNEVRVYVQCDAEADFNFKDRIFEPAPNVRGNIARTYLYFEQHMG